MLSISLLPNVFSILLNADNVLVYELVFPFIFAFVPVGLFQLYKKQLKFSDKSAFLSAFFFMSFFVFLGTWSRQEVALLFAVLVLMLVMGKYSEGAKTTALLLLFICSMVVSHYTTSYIFLFYLVVLLIGSILIGAKNRQKRDRSAISAALVVLAFFIAFSWYTYVSGGAPYAALASVGGHTVNNFASDFLSNPDPAIAAALGGGLSSLLFTHVLAHYWVIATEVLIAGGLALMVWWRSALRINTPFLLLSLASFFILLVSIAVPTVSNAIGSTRVYFLMSIFLAPYCIFAIETIADAISKWSRANKDHARKLKYAALIGVLVPYFLFNYGVIFEITEHPSNFAFLPSQAESERLLQYGEYQLVVSRAAPHSRGECLCEHVAFRHHGPSARLHRQRRKRRTCWLWAYIAEFYQYFNGLNFAKAVCKLLRVSWACKCATRHDWHAWCGRGCSATTDLVISDACCWKQSLQ